MNQSVTTLIQCACDLIRERIKSDRKRTYSDIAEAVGCSDSTIRNLMGGEILSRKYLDRLADLYSVDLDAASGDDPEPETRGEPFVWGFHFKPWEPRCKPKPGEWWVFLHTDRSGQVYTLLGQMAVEDGQSIFRVGGAITYLLRAVTPVHKYPHHGDDPGDLDWPKRYRDMPDGVYAYCYLNGADVPVPIDNKGFTPWGRHLPASGSTIPFDEDGEPMIVGKLVRPSVFNAEPKQS